MQNEFGFNKAVVQNVDWNIPDELIAARFDTNTKTISRSIIAISANSLISAINDGAAGEVDAVLIYDLKLSWKGIKAMFENKDGKNEVRTVIFKLPSKRLDLRFFGFKPADMISNEQFIDILTDFAIGRGMSVAYTKGSDTYVKVSKNKSD